MTKMGRWIEVGRDQVDRDRWELLMQMIEEDDMHYYSLKEGLTNLPPLYVPIERAIPIQDWVKCPGEYKETE